MAGFLLHRRRSIYQEFYQVTSEFAPIRVLPISSVDPEKEHSGALTSPAPLRVAHAYVPDIQNAARVERGRREGGGDGVLISRVSPIFGADGYRMRCSGSISS